jgi:hypothetical protein
MTSLSLRTEEQEARIEHCTFCAFVVAGIAKFFIKITGGFKFEVQQVVRYAHSIL